MNNEQKKAFRLWVGKNWKRAEVATIAMANSVNEVEPWQDLADRLELDRKTVVAWAEDWMAWYRQFREFDGDVLLADIVRMAEKDGGVQAANKLRHAFAGLIPDREEASYRRFTASAGPVVHPETGYEVEGFDDDGEDGAWDEDELESATEAHEAG